MATVTFGSTVLPLSQVIILGVLLTLVMLAAFSFVSRGIVYDLLMPASKLRSATRRPGARR